MDDVDPRLIKLVRELDVERQRRAKAERQAVALRNVLTRMRAERTADAVARREDQRHAGC